MGHKTKITPKKLKALLSRTHALIQHCRSRFDSAPIPAYMNRYPGHVEDDATFCATKEALLDDIREMLVEGDGELGYSQFLSLMEHSQRSIVPGTSPVWKGMTRCRCWWDARDELQAVADYLTERSSRGGTRRRRQAWASIITLVGLLVAVVTNLATDVVPVTLLPYRWLAWPFLALLVILSLVLAFLSN